VSFPLTNFFNPNLIPKKIPEEAGGPRNYERETSFSNCEDLSRKFSKQSVRKGEKALEKLKSK
jgi:hypothetical protein